jgi:hypothetical protein
MGAEGEQHPQVESLPKAKGNIKLLISSGFSSQWLFGSPKAIDFFQNILERCECTNFAGFEVVGWLPVLSKWKDNLQAYGIHGRCRVPLLPNIFMFAADRLIVSTRRLVKKFGQQEYILIHDREAAKTQKILENNVGKINTLFIENTPEAGSLDKTQQLIQALRDNGVNAGLMFDLVHYLAEIGCDGLKPEVSEETWNRMILRIDAVFNSLRAIYPDIPLGIHLPIGIREGLPVEKISDEMWQELAHITEAYELVLVIENQQMLSSYFPVGKAKRFEKISERNYEVFRRLRMCEVM